MEATMMGRCTTLIKDGVMDIHNLKATGTTRKRVLGQRNEYAIWEKSSNYSLRQMAISIVRSSSPGPGRCALPDEDAAFR
jgi:hypothetical protein